MDFLSIVSLPHSEQILRLLEILFFIGFSILISYFAYLFGSLIYSLYFYIKSKAFLEFLLVSKEYLEQSSKGILALFGLGLVPLLAVYYCLVQFIQKAPSDFGIVFITSFASFVLFAILSKVLLKALTLKFERNKINPTFIVLYFFCIVSLFVSAFLTIGVYNFSKNTGFQFSGIQPFEFLAIDTLIGSIIFIGIAFVLASLGYIFRKYTSDRITAEGVSFADTNVSRRLLANTLISGNILPILYLIWYISAPKNLVSFENFLFLVLSLIILLFSLILTYFSLKNNKVTLARLAFIVAIFSFSFFFASETSLLAVSNKVQEFKIARDYIAYHQQRLELAGRKVEVAVNGEEIYKAKCAACHLFETRLVGPPHKEVLKKYADRKEDMIKYILNPVKVDPNYPPMPNQGLKPNEAKAVVDYMFEHYGSMLK